MRRTAVVAAVLSLSTLGLTACGDDGAKGSVLDDLKVSGAVGAAPTFDWSKDPEGTSVDSKVLVEGDGAELAKGDKVLVNLAISNSYDGEVAGESYGADASGVAITVGEDPAEPQVLGDLFAAALADHVDPGMKLGTRIVVAGPIQKLFKNQQYAAAGASLGIGNEDPIAIVADLVSVPLDGPEGSKDAVLSGVPKVVEKDGEPVSLDFSGVPKPGAALEVTTLRKGTGEKVEAGDVVAVNYLGQVYGAEEKFDESYSRDDTLVFAAGTGVDNFAMSVVKGWSKGLVGVPVGSRVIIAIPPKLGYGAQGQGEQIKGTDTMFFVVDVLGAA